MVAEDLSPKTKHARRWLENLRRWDYLEILDVDGRIILKLTIDWIAQ
jgi:hypothetical protein